MPLKGEEFLRRYLQHVLPRGFHKVRYYGLLSPASRVKLQRVQLLLAEWRRNKEEEKQDAPQDAPRNICRCCKEGIMVIVSWLPRKPRSPPA